MFFLFIKFYLKSKILFLIVSNFCNQNIEKGQKYKVVFYVKARGRLDLDVSFVGSVSGAKLASQNFR